MKTATALRFSRIFVKSALGAAFSVTRPNEASLTIHRKLIKILAPSGFGKMYASSKN